MTGLKAEQGSFAGLGATKRKPRRTALPLAAELPVAQVALDLSQPHLDRLFDYAVPQKFDQLAQPGVRVSVPFAGRQVKGFIINRLEQSAHSGRLSVLSRVPSGLPVLTPGLWRLAVSVAGRQAGVVADVLRLAIPAAHVSTERRLLAALAEAPHPADDQAPAPVKLLAAGGASTLTAVADRLAAGAQVRAVWNYLPGADLLAGLVALGEAVVGAQGRQMLIVAPTEREVARLAAALEPRFRTGRLVASDGPAARLENYWGAASGALEVLVGTRAAAYAPLARPGVLVLVGEGDSALAEPHAPYAHARTVMAVRAPLDGASLVLAGLARTAEAQMLVEAGWAESVVPERAQVRAAVPVVRAPTAADLAFEGSTSLARLPSVAFTAIRQGLATGPVLVQVPAAGHETSGLARTTQELARAFAGVNIKQSGAATGVLDTVSGEPALVVASPGAEPTADGSYSALIALDGSAWTANPRLDAEIDALRIWMAAASLVRPGGEVWLIGSGEGAARQALVRWDPAGLAERELAERRQVGLPPAAKAIVVSGEPADVADLLRRFELPPGSRQIPEDGKTIVLVPLESARAAIAALRQAVSARSIANPGGHVRIKVDGDLD